jgi:hypothetical protein
MSSTASGPLMKKEYHLEINSAYNEPHVFIRCNTSAQAEEYAKRLFPKSYVRNFKDGVCYIYFSENEKNANNAIGMIQEVSVPSGWVSNRRVAEEPQRQAA